MKEIDKFKKQMKEKKIQLTKVRCLWPYDYDDDFEAFEININERIFYFCFSDNGKFLQKKEIKK